jgi:hypothetical protein
MVGEQLRIRRAQAWPGDGGGAWFRVDHSDVRPPVFVLRPGSTLVYTTVVQ